MIAPIVVLLAEAMTLVWFLAYLTLARALRAKAPQCPARRSIPSPVR
jgi:hypothetical protein